MMRTLFLDRDGVINTRLAGRYVCLVKDFIFISGTLEALGLLAEYFDLIVIVTNQQGIGKGLMTKEQLDEVHDYMLNIIRENGGRIDAVYYCPGVDTDNPACRKPNTGMAYTAKKDFPDLEFHKAWMVGDMPTDILFGRRLGMKTVLLSDNIDHLLSREVDADYYFSDLMEFATHIMHFYS